MPRCVKKELIKAKALLEEWWVENGKCQNFYNNIETIRLNPNDEQIDKDTIHIPLGSKNGIHYMFT